MAIALKILLVLILSYFIGSIPSGLIVVKLLSGKDVRKIESGRTGGTNAMRAAGLTAGVLTGLMDVIKGISSGWIVSQFLLSPYMQVFAAIFVIIGHNYSIFLIERTPLGKIKFRGGAGGAPCLGGAIALWPYIGIIVVPLSLAVFIFVGYASLTTISIAFFTTLVFLYRALTGSSPWTYVAYGILAQLILIYALRPNLQRLKAGTERLVGLPAYLKKKASRT